MPIVASYLPGFYGGPGAPNTGTGIIPIPELPGQTYAQVRLGDVYINTANGDWYRATAVSASSVTWTIHPV